MITAKLITDAWAHCRTTNHSISDEVLDFMKDVSLAALQSQNSGKPIVSGSLPLPDTLIRVEVIDAAGRSYVNWNNKNRISADLQDEGRTLKVFVKRQ